MPLAASTVNSVTLMSVLQLPGVRPQTCPAVMRASPGQKAAGYLLLLMDQRVLPSVVLVTNLLLVVHSWLGGVTVEFGGLMGTDHAPAKVVS